MTPAGGLQWFNATDIVVKLSRTGLTVNNFVILLAALSILLLLLFYLYFSANYSQLRPVIVIIKNYYYCVAVSLSFGSTVVMIVIVGTVDAVMSLLLLCHC